MIMRLAAGYNLLFGLALLIATPSQARSQWSVSLAVESDRFWGGSLENAPEHKSFRPYRPTVFGAGLQRQAGSIGLGVRVRYTEASLGLEGSDAVVALKGAFTVVGIAPEVSYRIVTLGPGNQLRIHLGPLVEFWDPIDVEGRTRLGAQGAVSLGVPLGGPFTLSLGGSLALISSPFEPDELIDGYERRALWRRGFAAGLQYQL
jgi:hypothetical protein